MSAIVAAHGPFDEAVGHRMLQRMAHRGPDGVGTIQVGQAWLGARYLSITDPKTGAQPLTGTQQKIWLVGDRKSTRLNSSHVAISYAVFCLNKTKNCMGVKLTSSRIRYFFIEDTLSIATSGRVDCGGIERC